MYSCSKNNINGNTGGNGGTVIQSLADFTVSVIERDNTGPS